MTKSKTATAKTDPANGRAKAQPQAQPQVQAQPHTLPKAAAKPEAGPGPSRAPAAKKRARSSSTGSGDDMAVDGGSGAESVGRDQRAQVEDPVMTSVQSRAAAKEQALNLWMRVSTSYRSVAGSRRQVVSSQRNSATLNNDELHATASSLPYTSAQPPDGQSGGAKSKTAQSGVLPVVQRFQWMVVPEFLSEDLWERHKYSMSDIRKTLDAFPPRTLWQLVISYNRPATNASSRICSDTDLRMTFGGKSTAIQKLLTVLEELHPEWCNRPSVTWNMSKIDDPNGDGQSYEVVQRHVPGLPVHRISRPTFDHLLSNLVGWPSTDDHGSMASLASMASMGSVGSVAKPQSSGQSSVTTKLAKSIFSWRDIHIVPLEINKANDLLLMGRVVPWSVYVKAYGLPGSLRTCPNFILAPDGYYALLDENFYFYAKPDLATAPAPMTDVAATADNGAAMAMATAMFKTPAPKPVKGLRFSKQADTSDGDKVPTKRARQS